MCRSSCHDCSLGLYSAGPHDPEDCSAMAPQIFCRNNNPDLLAQTMRGRTDEPFCMSKHGVSIHRVMTRLTELFPRP
jgi:hypothetical protein